MYCADNPNKNKATVQFHYPGKANFGSRGFEQSCMQTECQHHPIQNSPAFWLLHPLPSPLQVADQQVARGLQTGQIYQKFVAFVLQHTKYSWLGPPPKAVSLLRIATLHIAPKTLSIPEVLVAKPYPLCTSQFPLL